MTSIFTSLWSTGTENRGPSPKAVSVAEEKMAPRTPRAADLSKDKLTSMRKNTPKSKKGSKAPLKETQNVKSNHDSPNSRKTIRSLSRALTELLHKHEELQSNFDQQTGELEAIKEEVAVATEEKRALKETMGQLENSSKNQLDNLRTEKEELAILNQELLAKVAKLESEMSKKTQESDERLRSVLSGQEQLEQALDLIKKQNQPWWQCL